MNYFSLERNVQLICMLTLFLAAIVWITSPASLKVKKVMVSSIVLGLIILFFVQPYAYNHVLERLQYKTHYAGKEPFKYVVQNRHGIVTVAKGTTKSHHNDVIYGGGYYDGKFNIDPVSNSNYIRRAYMFSALHRHPEEVLSIGLASGSWARVVGDYPMVKKITIVELNPGYMQVIPYYPHINSILYDPRSTVIVDDGRRWLNRNPDKKFDFILMNTTFHWRDGATNLLSLDFIKMCRNHLKEGGLIYYNATGCEDIFYTAAQVFRHVTKVGTLVAASDSPFDLTREEKRGNLLKFNHEGISVFSGDSSKNNVLEILLKRDLSDRGDKLRNRTDLICVTDDNMATEYKTGSRKVFQLKNSWAHIFEK